MKRKPLAPDFCDHAADKMKRYGNRSGKFAFCTLCETRWRWAKEVNGWVHWPASQRSQPPRLPLPSQGTIRDPCFELGSPTLKVRPSMTSASSKEAPRPKVRPMRTEPSRSRDQVRDMDEDMRSIASRSERGSDRRRVSRRAPTETPVEDDISIITDYDWDDTSTTVP